MCDAYRYEMGSGTWNMFLLLLMWQGLYYYYQFITSFRLIVWIFSSSTNDESAFEEHVADTEKDYGDDYDVPLRDVNEESEVETAESAHRRRRRSRQPNDEVMGEYDADTDENMQNVETENDEDEEGSEYRNALGNSWAGNGCFAIKKPKIYLHPFSDIAQKSLLE